MSALHRVVALLRGPGHVPPADGGVKRNRPAVDFSMRSTTSIVRRRGMTPRAKSFGFITFITSTISTLKMRLRAGNGRQRSSDAGLQKTLLAQEPAGSPIRPHYALPTEKRGH